MNGRIFSRVLAAGALVMAASACYPKVAAAPGPLSPAGVDRAAARWPGATAASLTAARERFLGACNQCHGYPDLAAFSEEEWPSILDRMAGKAHLDADAKASVLRFILAARSEQASR